MWRENIKLASSLSRARDHTRSSAMQPCREWHLNCRHESAFGGTTHDVRGQSQQMQYSARQPVLPGNTPWNGSCLWVAVPCLQMVIDA